MKLKTHKATAKRIKLTKGKKKRKILSKKSGQDHFNARESGRVTRNKRRRKAIAKADARNIRRQIPYA